MTLWFTSPAFTQLVITKDASGKSKYSLYVPKSNIIDAASFVPKAALALQIKKPANVQLDPLAQLTKAKNTCPFLKAPKPSLELDGERISNGSVGLEWKAFNGSNNLGFEVERSFDDTFHFERVNYVWANSIAGINDKYELPDGNAYSKISFYRLRLIFRNGEYLYSNIAKVGGYTNNALFAYPNPASGSLTLNATADEEGTASVKIFDGAGKVIWQQTSLMNEGTNVRTINVNNLAAGAYTVRVELKDQSTRTVKFIKQ